MTDDALRVLVVEDDPDLVLVMRHELALAGHTVFVATTADEAVSQAPDVDLVLLDFHLPGANGLDVLQRIQALGEAPSVVMVTGDDLGGLDEAAMRAGAVDFVPKRPGYLRALPGIVQRAARQHDLGRRIAGFEAVALSLMAAEERDEAIAEILHGACRILRAQQAAMVRLDTSERQLLAQVGGAQALVDSVHRMPTSELPGPGHALPMDPEALIVTLPATAGEGQLALVVGQRRPGPLARDESELAQAYARMAASALQAARRRRIEAEVLEELQATMAKRTTNADRRGAALLEHLERSREEITDLLDGDGLDPATVRVLARAEAHLSAAVDEAGRLLGGGDEG